MKKVSLFILACITSLQVFCQDYSSLQSIQFNTKGDYKKHEAKIAECASYLLQVPLHDKNPNRLYAMQLLLKWMTGTPDYTFHIDESIGKVIKKEEAMLGIYMASMTKFVLEHKDKSKDQNEIKLQAVKTLLNYCRNSSNKVELTKDIKRMIEADDNGQLQQYLQI